MAKRNSTRRKARKPKLIEVEGHQLTEAMHEDYERCIESRARTNGGRATAARIEELALGDFLAGYRPSKKIEGQLVEICLAATHVGLAVGAMDGYTFSLSGPAMIRSAGCKLLQELGLELYNLSAKVTAIAM